VAAIFISFRATKNEHRVLDTRLSALILVTFTSLALVWGVALCSLLTALRGDVLLVGVALLGEMRDQETMVLAWAIYDLVELAMVVFALSLLVATALFGVGDELSCALVVLFPDEEGFALSAGRDLYLPLLVLTPSSLSACS
jgi:hypothetical protein